MAKFTRQIFHKIARLFSIVFSWPWRRRLPCWAMCPAIFGGRGPMSLQYSFDSPCQLKNWLRVQGGCRQALLFWATSSPLLYQVSAARLSESSESPSSWCDGSLRWSSINPPRYASFSRTWDVDAASNELDSILILLSGLPEAIGINRTRCCGWNCRNTIRRHTHHCWSRLGHNPFFFFLFLNYFAIVVQPIKLKFLVQRRELKWLICWTNEEDCSTRHVWNFPLSTCLRVGVWCQCNGFDFLVQINPVKQPIQSNSVGPWNMSHCGTSTFDNHFDYRLIVLKDIQHGTGIRILCIGWNVVNVGWNDVGVLHWDGVMHVWRGNCRRVSPWLSLGTIILVRYWMKYFSHQVPKNNSGNTVHA